MQGQLLEFLETQRKTFTRLIQRALFLNGSSLAAVASAAVICVGLSILPAQADPADYDFDTDFAFDSPSTTTKNIPSGLQPTTTKLLAPGSVGGNTQIPSGQYTFGFSTSGGSGSSVYPGLPPTSLSSLDINIVDN
jgi:hypothetical protein